MFQMVAATIPPGTYSLYLPGLLVLQKRLESWGAVVDPQGTIKSVCGGG